MSVSFSAHGKRIVFGSKDHTVCMWSADTGECLSTFRGHTDYICSIAFSLNVKRIALGSLDYIKIWDTEMDEVLSTLAGHTGAVRTVVFPPDNTRIVSDSVDRKFCVWDAMMYARVLNISTNNSVFAVSFSPDSQRIISGCYDGFESETHRLGSIRCHLLKLTVDLLVLLYHPWMENGLSRALLMERSEFWMRRLEEPYRIRSTPN